MDLSLGMSATELNLNSMKFLEFVIKNELAFVGNKFEWTIEIVITSMLLMNDVLLTLRARSFVSQKRFMVRAKRNLKSQQIK